jgi:DNA-nicking Smr family endonuclease
MSDPTAPSDPDFAAAMAGVRPISRGSRAVSGVKPLVLALKPRQTSQDRLDLVTKPGKIAPSSRQIDGQTAKKLAKGAIKPQDRLDLHGYRLEAARAAVRNFLGRAIDRGLRSVMIVTGKGGAKRDQEATTPWGHDDGRALPGGIRRALPGWLAEKPFDYWVLRAAPAAERDGGAGAVYVYLRRDRENT